MSNKPVTSIPLGQNYAAIVDSDTFERLKLGRFEFYPQIIRRKGEITAVYAVARRVNCSLHRIIMEARPGQKIDHRNGDGLDNRDENLRIATSAENGANRRRPRHNSSGLKGVTWSPSAKKWMAQIATKGTRYYLGIFAHKQRAAKAYDRAALFLFGDFAALNYENLRATYRPVQPKQPIKRTKPTEPTQ